MPLKKFEIGRKWGLKNTSDKIIVEAKFDEIHLISNVALASYYELDENEDYEKLVILSFDLSGDIMFNISKELDKQGIDNVIEFWHIKDRMFGFQYSDWDSMELSGVFREDGQVIIEPNYDEIELISDYLILCFHGEHYEEFDELGDKNYGHKLYDFDGEKLENESIKEFEEIENDDLEFITISNRKFITDKYGRIKE